MKSREEYTASIFAKRDALLEKRKKRITAAISAVCIALSFAAAAAFVPKTINKTKGDITTETTVQAIVTQTSSAVQYEEQVDYLLREEIYQPPKAEAETGKGPTINNQTDFYNGALIAPTYKPFQDAPETAITYDDLSEEERKESIDQAQTTKKSNSIAPKYTDDEIIQVAYEFLSNEQKALVNKSDEKLVLATHTSDGQNFYEVHFNGKIENYSVKLNADDLSLVEIKAYVKSVQKTSGAYIPTTAAPPFMPQ